MGSTSGDDQREQCQAWLASAARGDAQAWRDLINRYTPRVFALILHRCGDRDLSDEITQATFVKLVTQLRGYKEQGKFEPWLFRIAMNVLRDEMRRRQRQARPTDFADQALADPQPAAYADPAQQAERAEQIERLRLAVAQLPQADQQILHLRHTAGLSFAQIAQTLEQPLGTVLARGHRALGKLTKMMAEQDEPSARTT